MAFKEACDKVNDEKRRLDMLWETALYRSGWQIRGDWRDPEVIKRRVKCAEKMVEELYLEHLEQMRVQ